MSKSVVESPAEAQSVLNATRQPPKEADMPIVPHIRGKFTLVVPVDDPHDDAAIRAVFKEHPVFGKAFSDDGGILELTPCRPPNPRPGQVMPPELVIVPIRPVRLGTMQRRAVVIPAEGERPAVPAVSLRLPEDVVRIYRAWEQAPVHSQYQWSKFLQSLKQDYDSELGRAMRPILAARINGLQGQAWTGDPRLSLMGPNYVGVGRMLARRLARLVGVRNVHGLWVFLQRYPVAHPAGARWVQLVVFKDVEDELIRVHGEGWVRLHQGDADGDIAYIGCQTPLFGPMIEVPDYPRFVLADGRSVLDDLVSQWLIANEEVIA